MQLWTKWCSFISRRRISFRKSHCSHSYCEKFQLKSWNCLWAEDVACGSISMWPSETKRENTAVDVRPSDRHISTEEAGAPVCLRGPNPARRPRPTPCALLTLWSHVPASDGGPGRSRQLPCASSLSVCRCCRRLFVFRDSLFSSVASVSCSAVAGVTCLWVGRFPAAEQLKLHVLGAA